MTEDELYNLSDEELEAAFKEARAEEVSPEEDSGIDEKFDNSDTGEEQEDIDTGTIEVSDEDQEDQEVVTDDEEIESGPEQPDEDSDHDASEEDEEEDKSDEDIDTEEDDNPDKDSETDESTTTDDKSETKSEAQQAQTLKFKANGQEYEFSDKEIVDQFPRIFGQAMDYTKKMQTIKPWRKTIDAIEQAKLGHDDVNLMIDALGGNKDAVAQVLKRTGTDALDLDLENDSYKPQDYGRDETALAIKDVVETISEDKEFAITENILSKQWDDTSWQEMTKDPETIRLLHEDVKSGMYDTISPIMSKLKVYDGAKKSDLDYYKEAAQQYFSELDNKQNEEVLKQQEQEKAERQQEAEAQKQKRLESAKAKESKRKVSKQASVKRKAAAPTKSRATSKTAVDYLEDTDEAFEEWYKDLMD